MIEATVVSVDLDGIGCYHAIHGLPAPSPAAADVVLLRCLPRYLDLFEELGVRATFFVIGHELEAAGEAGGAVLRRALAAGHELGNHSHAHAYDLVTWSGEALRADLERCDATLRSLGAEPIGFRAPGYTHDAAMLRVVAELGYRYDASSLPSLPYYAAKLAVMGTMALRGRRSQSMARGWRSFVGPTEPWRREDIDLWELPISVTPGLRVPLIGTSMLASGPWMARTLARAARDRPYFHLELHGLDLADPETDDYDSVLRRLQPELGVSLSLKRRRLVEILRSRPPAGTLAGLCSELRG